MSVKNYYRFKLNSVFGLVGTSAGTATLGGIQLISRGKYKNRYVAVSANEFVIIWDTKKEDKDAEAGCLTSSDVRGVVSTLRVCPMSDEQVGNEFLAVGYTSGDVVIFSINQANKSEPVIFSGHSSAVRSLAWNASGKLLASGGADGEIVIWDHLSERGLLRFRAHSRPITRLLWMGRRPSTLVSCGEDGHVKFWDTQGSHCFKTITPTTQAVWDIGLFASDTRLVVGGNDQDLHVYRLLFTDEGAAVAGEVVKETPAVHQVLETRGETEVLVPDVNTLPLPVDDASCLRVTYHGSLQRSRTDKVGGMDVHGDLLVVHSKYNKPDVFQIRPPQVVKEKIQKRLRKVQKRIKQGETIPDAVTSEESQLADEIKVLPRIPFNDKICRITLSVQDDQASITALHGNNSIRSVSFSTQDSSQSNDTPVTHIQHLTKAGHRAEVHHLQVHQDQIYSVDATELKTWKRIESEEVVCTATLPLTSSVRSLALAPGKRHAVLGTDDGSLLMVDLVHGDITQRLVAHEKEVTALAVTANSKGLISGSHDGHIRCWHFELVEDERYGRRLTLEHTENTITTEERITCIACSPCGQFVGVALQNMKEYLYHADTMKLHKELYGKSLPANCIDFSGDGELLVTGSKDSNVRIYSTRHGEERRILKNAHTGEVTCVAFEGSSRLFFSAGQDGQVHQWDSRSFERVFTLRDGHSGCVRALAINPKGTWFVTAAMDHSMRVWTKTDELLELSNERAEERERETELTQNAEEALGNQLKHVEGEAKDSQVVRASRPSYRTNIAIGILLDALDMIQQQLTKPSDTHYLLSVHQTDDPFLCFTRILDRIKASELEEMVVQLELFEVMRLLTVLVMTGDRGKFSRPCVRIGLVAFRSHAQRFMADKRSWNTIRKLQAHCEAFTLREKRLMGFNRAAFKLEIIKEEKKNNVSLYQEALGKQGEKKQRKKRREEAQRRMLLDAKD